MSGVFNSTIFNNTVFNTGSAAPVAPELVGKLKRRHRSRTPYSEPIDVQVFVPDPDEPRRQARRKASEVATLEKQKQLAEQRLALESDQRKVATLKAQVAHFEEQIEEIEVEELVIRHFLMEM